jgi:hypothetical protein
MLKKSSRRIEAAAAIRHDVAAKKSMASGTSPLSPIGGMADGIRRLATHALTSGPCSALRSQAKKKSTGYDAAYRASHQVS